MTAEVLVMNRESVALAADSAVTNGSKIYESANKLFTLRKEFPVGVMISNAAYFSGVPWETLVKLYRQEHFNQRPEATVEEYTRDFLGFIQNSRFYNDRVQQTQIAQIAHACLEAPASFSKKSIDQKFFTNRKCSTEEANEIAHAELTSFRDHVRIRDDYAFEKVDEETLRSEFENTIQQSAQALFNMIGVNLDDSTLDLATGCVILVLLKEYPSTAHSTIAIVGFGDDELFPSYQLMTIDGMIGGELKVFDKVEQSIDRYGRNVVIQPMGQSDMVSRFMKGVDSAYHEAAIDYFRNFCGEAGMKEEQVSKAVGDFEESLSKHQREYFVDPIIRTVQHLPRTDLANMAESLVSLTSIKRRVSEELETVAGPIDVAIISKGDGFIWMKRKHYFDSDLNPHHRELYFRGVSYE